VTYANLDNWTPSQSTNQFSLLDRWMLSKLQRLVIDVSESLTNYDPTEATGRIEKFIEELSTWYIRRSRRRFWKSRVDDDKNAAYTTLYRCIITLTRILGPFTPFIAEEIYQNLVVGIQPVSLQSIHHTPWPIEDRSLIDDKLIEDMDVVIAVASLGRSIRSKSGIKLRQPLPRVVVATSTENLRHLEEFIDLIKDELNVREVELTTQESQLTKQQLSLIPSRLGKKYGVLYPKLREAVTNMNSEELVHSLREKLSVDIQVEDRTITLLPEDVEVKDVPREGYGMAADKDMMIGLDTVISKELAVEGLAKDIVRRIQNQRKEAGFNIADEIETYYETGPKLREVFASYGEYISSETLTKVLEHGIPPENAFVAEYTLEGEPLKLGLVQLRKDSN